MILVVCGAFFQWLLVPVVARPADGSSKLVPVRAEKAPVIDGKLDDQVWQQAPFVTGFKTFSPDFGYGSLFEKVRWDDGRYLPGKNYLETQRSLFFKASYPWRF